MIKIRTGGAPPPRSVTHHTGSLLPPFVVEYLAHGAAPGERNAALYKAAQQYFAAGINIEIAMTELGARANTDGLNEVEAHGAIRHGYQSTTVTQPITGRTSTPFRRNSGRETGPKVAGTSDFERVLRAAFGPDEHVAIVESYVNEGAWTPGTAKIKSRDAWLSQVGKLGGKLEWLTPNEGGTFMGINPYNPGATRRLNTEISDYRHVLVEWDGAADGSDKPRHHARLLESGLPITAIIDSGKKSVHGWVRVDATTPEEWRRRCEFLFSTLGCDPKNNDLARLSRCAGAIREVNGVPHEQKLLGVNIGATSWEEWVADKGMVSADTSIIPDVVNAADWMLIDIPEPPQIITGIIHEGSKLIFGGPSKARKSWAMIDLAICVASGIPWWGHHTNKSPVLYVNLELPDWHSQYRVRTITKKKLAAALPIDYYGLDILNLKFVKLDLPRLITHILAAAAKRGTPYKLIIIDPIYKTFMEWEESSAKDMKIMVGMIDDLILATGATVVYAAHFTKGSQHEKAAMDRISGSGVLSRDPDTILVMSEHEEEHCMTVDPIRRCIKWAPSFVIRWDDVHWIQDPSLDPDHLKGRRKSKEKDEEKMPFRPRLPPSGKITITSKRKDSIGGAPGNAPLPWKKPQVMGPVPGLWDAEIKLMPPTKFMGKSPDCLVVQWLMKTAGCGFDGGCKLLDAAQDSGIIKLGPGRCMVGVGWQDDGDPF